MEPDTCIGYTLFMEQTGAGTLTPDQVELLRTGFLAFVEKPQPVMITDITRLPNENGIIRVDPAVIPGIIFYLHHVACEAAHVEGYILFHVIKNASSAPIASLITQEIGRKVVAGCAIKIKKVVIGRLFAPLQACLLDNLAHKQGVA